MARLKASLNTNRAGRRGGGGVHPDEQTHRLGDHWVHADVANWEERIAVELTDKGNVLLLIESGYTHLAIRAESIPALMARLRQEPVEKPVEVVRHRRSRRTKMRLPSQYTIPEEDD